MCAEKSRLGWHGFSFCVMTVKVGN